MLLTLAAVVCCAALIILFSQEIARVGKKIYAIKGAQFILPLFLLSWLVITYDYWIIKIIAYYRELLSTMIQYSNKIAPTYQSAHYISVIALLTIISIGPIFALNWYYRRRTYKPYPYPYFLSSILWLLTAFTIIVIN